jgi:hypothetical protein
MLAGVGTAGCAVLLSSLSEEAVGPRTFPLTGDTGGRRLVYGTYRWFARPARTAAGAPEGVQVSGKNGPHDADFDSVQSLPEQQPAHVGFRCLELGSSLGDREQAGALDREILARRRNIF